MASRLRYRVFTSMRLCSCKKQSERIGIRKRILHKEKIPCLVFTTFSFRAFLTCNVLRFFEPRTIHFSSSSRHFPPTLVKFDSNKEHKGSYCSRVTTARRCVHSVENRTVFYDFLIILPGESKSQRDKLCA